MKRTAGTFKLALALAIVDVLLMVILCAAAPVLYGTTTWFSEWVALVALVVGYRLASLQPLYLYLILKLFRQRLDSFSRGLAMAISSVSSLLSILVIGFLFTVLAGEAVIASIAQAFVFFKSFVFGMRNSLFIPALFVVLLLSPLLVFHCWRLLGDDVK